MVPRRCREVNARLRGRGHYQFGLTAAGRARRCTGDALRMRRRTKRWGIRIGALVLVVAATLIVYRAVASQMGPPLRPWHTFVPHDAACRGNRRHADWPACMAAEDRVFDEVRPQVTDRLDAQDRTPRNRYFADSPIYPGHFTQDWNRSYVLEPDGPPRGAVVLLHGLTDSPYSLRHIARRYRDARLRRDRHPAARATARCRPALTDVEWEDWVAATRLAVREARRRARPDCRCTWSAFPTAARWR